jgi:hypothetical protein
MDIPDFIFENLIFLLKYLNFDANSDPGSYQPWIRDGKNRGFWIRDKHPGPQHCFNPLEGRSGPRKSF